VSGEREPLGRRILRAVTGQPVPAQPLEPQPVEETIDLTDEHMWPRAAESYTYNPAIPAWRPPEPGWTAEMEQAANDAREADMTQEERNKHRRLRFATRRKWELEQEAERRKTAAERQAELEERGRKYGSLSQPTVSGVDEGGYAHYQRAADERRKAAMRAEREAIRAQNTDPRWADPRLGLGGRRDGDDPRAQ
jgi:hypothetical protein